MQYLWMNGEHGTSTLLKKCLPILRDETFEWVLGPCEGRCPHRIRDGCLMFVLSRGGNVLQNIIHRSSPKLGQSDSSRRQPPGQPSVECTCVAERDFCQISFWTQSKVGAACLKGLLGFHSKLETPKTVYSKNES